MRRPELPQRRQRLLALLDRTRVAEDHANHGLPAHRLRDEVGVRCGEQTHARADLVRAIGHHVPEVRQHRARHRGRVHEHAAQDRRADRMELELEAGDSAEVAAAPARAQKRSGFSLSEAVRILPSAVTVSTERRLSTA